MTKADDGATGNAAEEWRTGWPLVLSCTFGLTLLSVGFITAGTFMRGVIHVGDQRGEGGRAGERLAASYVNFYVCNGGVIMPAFGLPAFDGDMTGMPPGINPARAKNWAFDVVQFYPNTVMILGNSFHIEMTFWPVDEDNTHITGANYMYPAKNLGERLSQDFVISRGRFVVRDGHLLHPDLPHVLASHARHAARIQRLS